MYTIYLRAPDQSITKKTRTSSRSVALSAFATLIEDTEFDGTMMRAILNHQDIAIAHHRFSVAPGNDDFWRGRVDQLEIAEPTVSIRETVGGKITMFLDADLLARAEKLGRGDAAEGVRRALRQPRDPDELALFNSVAM